MDFNQLSTDDQETVKRMVSFCLNKRYCLGMAEGYEFHPVHNDVMIRDNTHKALAEFAGYEPDADDLFNEKLVEILPQTNCPHCGHAMDRVNDDVYCPNGCYFEPYSEPQEIIALETQKQFGLVPNEVLERMGM